ncbi:BgTH12-05905 [Blumeria graminis f. sp. triticale]|uniref:Bgt-20547 n=3 Tax=Blumeria graminis TaxID=34373 RepID=A0A381LFX4_BLUGR|nr:BgTH12-05905 [Blumeria graminis f. sp. triticale]VDB90942.1 Bgt-20547 [Blumeria graminis f. sp. tritici]
MVSFTSLEVHYSLKARINSSFYSRIDFFLTEILIIKSRARLILVGTPGFKNIFDHTSHEEKNQDH